MAKAKDNPTNCTPTSKSDPVKEMNELYNTNGGGDKAGSDGKVGGVGSSKERDVIHNLYNSNGEFKDETLEQKYKKYVDKKTKKGLPAKNREKWKEAVDYWSIRSEQGKKFANEKFEEFKKENKGALREITISVHDPEKNETVKIRVDAIVYDKKENRYKIQEYKSSENAPYTRNQSKGFEILYKYGGVVVGEGKEEGDAKIVGGAIIYAGTDVEVVRPSGPKYYNKDNLKENK